MHEYELYGASLFETLLAKRGKFWRLSQHWQRLCQSAKQLSFKPPTYDAFLASLRQTHDPSKEEVLRLTLQRTGGLWNNQPVDQAIVVLARPHHPAREAAQLHLSHQRLACNDFLRLHKTGSRIIYQHLLAQAAQVQCSDCLLIDAEDRILETCYGNIMWRNEGQWYTPKASLGLLPGIYRQWLLETKKVRESVLHLSQLSEVEGFLICNTVQGARLVSKIGNQPIEKANGTAFIGELAARSYQPINQEGTQPA